MQLSEMHGVGRVSIRSRWHWERREVEEIDNLKLLHSFITIIL